jgi:hypothetical protein
MEFGRCRNRTAFEDARAAQDIQDIFGCGHAASCQLALYITAKWHARLSSVLLVGLAGWINQQQRDVIFTGSAITTVSPTIDITVRQAAGAS